MQRKTANTYSAHHLKTQQTTLRFANMASRPNLTLLVIMPAASAILVVQSMKRSALTTSVSSGAPTDTSDDVQIETSPTIHTITKQIGRTRPGEETKVTFDVKNPSQSKWTIKSIEPTCKCTSATADRDYIPAGEVASFTLNYRSGTKPKNDRVVVKIRFIEADAPIAHLVIEAHIRPDLNISPPELSLGTITSGKPGTFDFIVENYSSAEWNSISVGEVEGLSCEITPVAVIRGSTVKGNSECRQAWKVAARFTPQEEQGTADGLFSIPIHGGDSAVTPLIVTYRLERPLISIPPRCTISATTRGETEKRITIVAATAELAATAFEITASPTNLISARIIERRGKFADLIITVVGDETMDKEVSGSVELRDPGSPKTLLTIPIECRFMDTQTATPK